MPIPARELILREIAAANANLTLLERLLENLDAEEQPIEVDEVDEEVEPKPKPKKKATRRPRSAGDAAAANLPEVLQSLKAGPKAAGDICKELGSWSPQKLRGVLETFSAPSANGNALFEKEDPDNRLSKWRLTAHGRQQAYKGE